MTVPQQYIRCTARGDRWRIARVASARGVPFMFATEISVGEFVGTVGRVELSYKSAVLARCARAP